MSDFAERLQGKTKSTNADISIEDHQMKGIIIMQRFAIPSRGINFGSGSLASVTALGSKRAMIVTGGHSMKKSGVMDRLKALLEDAGAEVSIFDGVHADPSVQVVEQGASAMKEFDPDWVFALGGGSAIDAAKVMWALYERDDLTFTDMLTWRKPYNLRKKARLCAIGSTSGTGSEVTMFAVITDQDTGIKHPIGHPELLPDLAIVDPDLTKTLPPKVVADTGMDALSHATESYVARNRTEYSDAMALHAIVMICNNIHASWEGNEAARANMHNAQCIAGIAFNNAGLGITHSLAHKASALWEGGHITHGAANAIFLPNVIRFNAKDEQIRLRYAEIARYLDIQKGTSEESAEALAFYIENLRDSMDMASGIGAYENGMVPREEFDEKIEFISEQALQDACSMANPVMPTVDDLRDILLECF